MSRILIVTAVDVEARGLARHLGLTRVCADGDHRYRGRDVDLVCAGPRATRLPWFTTLARTASLVVSAGSCGALAPHLEEGDLVVPEAVLRPGGRRFLLPESPGLTRRGTLLTVDDVVETAGAKAQLWQETAAVAVDMESAVIVEWATTLGVPAVVVRGVADTSARGVPGAFARVVDEHGRTRVGRAMQVVFTRPRALSEALALRRGTAAALGSVAAGLRTLGPSKP